VGQDFLPQPGQIFTTVAKAQRLGGNAVGLAAWEARAITKPDGGALWVTATPARHGPAGIEALSGDVVGFVLSVDEGPTIMSPATRSGSMASPSWRAASAPASCCCSWAPPRSGPFHLTMDVNDAIETAHAFPQAQIVPVHCDPRRILGRRGTTSRRRSTRLAQRLRLLAPGIPAVIGA